MNLDLNPAVAELSRIREEQVDAVAMLEENVRSMGGKADQQAGAWGAFAHAVQGAANLFGANSAIEALQTGETSGKKGYEDALEDENVMAECKEMIRSRSLPSVNEHIGTLERLQKAA